QINSNGTGDSSVQILLAINESSGRALWEIGYMLENLILQATSLGLRFETILCDTDTRVRWEKIGVNGTRASCILRTE
ncbi:MAG: hypothetical protein ACYC0V_18295, partial [Armatimonadota bacterium]